MHAVARHALQGRACGRRTARDGPNGRPPRSPRGRHRLREKTSRPFKRPAPAGHTGALDRIAGARASAPRAEPARLPGPLPCPR